MNTVGISSHDEYLLLLLLLLQMMFKVPSISTHAGSQTSTPLIHCLTDDVVIQVAPLLYKSLRQVVDVTNSWAVDTLCSEIQLITSLNRNLSPDAKLLSKFDLPCWLPFCFCLCKNYVNADINIGKAYVSKQYALAVLATAIFDHLFIKGNVSAMDGLVVVKFHTNIANWWLFVIQKIMAIILYS